MKNFHQYVPIDIKKKYFIGKFHCNLPMSFFSLVFSFVFDNFLVVKKKKIKLATNHVDGKESDEFKFPTATFETCLMRSWVNIIKLTYQVSKTFVILNSYNILQ
jgi:hypothetical protein